MAGDAEPNDPGTRLRVFTGILLLHLAVRIGTGAFPVLLTGEWAQPVLGTILVLCCALWFIERLAPMAVAVAICALLALLNFSFPATGNHSFLEIWILLLLLVIGQETRDERVVTLSAIRWSLVIVFFYSGLQKALHGTYIDGQFLMFQIALNPEFEKVFGLIMPVEELARLKSIPLNEMGAGPFRTSSPVLLLASNAVYLFEMFSPFFLMWRRTRAAAIAVVLLFTTLIQAGAREVFFAGLFANSLLLFAPTDVHRRAVWILVPAYLLLGLLWLFGVEVVVR